MTKTYEVSEKEKQNILEPLRENLEEGTQVLAQLISSSGTGNFRMTFLVPVREKDDGKLRILCLDFALSKLFGCKINTSVSQADGIVTREDRGRGMIEELAVLLFGHAKGLTYWYPYG